MKKKLKVLIMEEAGVAAVIVGYLKQIGDTEGIDLEPVVAVSSMEASARLGEVDAAIINIDRQGTGIAYEALGERKIPVIGISSDRIPFPETIETDTLRLVSRPEICFMTIRSAICDFAKIADQVSMAA